MEESKIRVNLLLYIFVLFVFKTRIRESPQSILVSKSSGVFGEAGVKERYFLLLQVLCLTYGLKYVLCVYLSVFFFLFYITPDFDLSQH